jgi:putative ABC transport system permease protein
VDPHPPHRHRHRLGFVLTALLVTVGVATFVGLRATVHDLGNSLDHFYATSQFADLTVIGGDTDAIAQEAGHVKGVEAVNTRGTTTLSVFLRNGKTKVQGTIIGIPATGPELNRPSITAGRAFARGTGDSVAIVEQHTADDLGVKPGDQVTALGIGSQAGLDIVGVGLSPEYLLPAQSQQQVITTPGSFAVLFVPEVIVEELGGGATVQQVLVRYESGVDRKALDARLTKLANAHDAELVEPRLQQPSNGVIEEEKTGFHEASIVVPTLALIVAALVAALACARVDDERRRRRALLITVVASGVGGVVLGLLGAVLAGPALADAVYLPEHVGANNLLIAGVGFVLALLTGAVALGLGMLLRLGSDESLGAGPAFVTAVAAAAAMICVVAPGGVTDSAEATLDAAGRLEQVSAQVAFLTPVTAADLASLTAIHGIAVAEPVPSGNIFVRHGNRRYSTELEAFPRDTKMQRFEAPDGRAIELPATGVLIPQSLGAILDAKPGDELEITLPGAGVPPFTVPVAALTSNTLGNLVFLSNAGLRDAMGASANAFAGGLFDTASIQFEPGADAAKIASEVQAMPGIVVYVPVAASLNSVAEARPIFSAVIVALIAIGAIVTALGLGIAVVLHTHARRRIGGRRLTVEVLAAVVAGIVVGAALGTFAADRLVDALDSELIHLARHVDRSTYLLASGMVLIVSLTTLAVGFFSARRRSDLEVAADTVPTAVQSTS